MFGKKLINTELEGAQQKKNNSVTTSNNKQPEPTRNHQSQASYNVNMGQLSSSGSSGSAQSELD